MTPEEIKIARQTLKLTQNKFAKLLGVSTRSVQNWEKGDRNISAPLALLIKEKTDSVLKDKEETLSSNTGSKVDKIEILQTIKHLLKHDDSYLNDEDFRDYLRSKAKQILATEEIQHKIDSKMEELKSIMKNKITND